ncbi:MAG: T9SS type A sorting domain-containing protein [Bacteroidales bacterium]|nr:T9SS type A sorting domain-containing protein [Bacteroidales bacterium]
MNCLKYILIFSYTLFLAEFVLGQYAPPAGEEGSTAIYMDSSVFTGWATDCYVIRGPMNASDPGAGPATYGAPSDAIGNASDNRVVSLGDGGIAVLSFNDPVVNRNGPDFAVFENSFNASFLELGFVEVSTDSVSFVRFPAVSLTQTDSQVNSFGNLDATLIHNLAGKYRAGYGTPFDLKDLIDSVNVDISEINFIRIIDVTGSIIDSLASYDSEGNKINDPWPTPFETGGFDLDAVGVINSIQTTGFRQDLTGNGMITIYPNPCNGYFMLSTGIKEKYWVELFDLSGKSLYRVMACEEKIKVDLEGLPKGVILVRVVTKKRVITGKVFNIRTLK